MGWELILWGWGLGDFNFGVAYMEWGVRKSGRAGGIL